VEFFKNLQLKTSGKSEHLHIGNDVLLEKVDKFC